MTERKSIEAAIDQYRYDIATLVTMRLRHGSDDPRVKLQDRTAIQARAALLAAIRADKIAAMRLVRDKQSRRGEEFVIQIADYRTGGLGNTTLKIIPLSDTDIEEMLEDDE